MLDDEKCYALTVNCGRCRERLTQFFLLAGLCLILRGQITRQTFTLLHKLATGRAISSYHFGNQDKLPQSCCSHNQDILIHAKFLNIYIISQNIYQYFSTKNHLTEP